MSQWFVIFSLTGPRESCIHVQQLAPACLSFFLQQPSCLCRLQSHGLGRHGHVDARVRRFTGRPIRAHFCEAALREGAARSTTPVLIEVFQVSLIELDVNGDTMELYARPYFLRCHFPPVHLLISTRQARVAWDHHRGREREE